MTMPDRPAEPAVVEEAAQVIWEAVNRGGRLFSKDAEAAAVALAEAGLLKAKEASHG